MLMLCAFIWGTAFVAQSAGSGMGAYSFLAGRSWLAVLVLIVLKSGRRRRAGRMRGGCGCAPLGWLFSLLGLNVLIDMFRRRS